jgi:hypothetical protein
MPIHPYTFRRGLTADVVAGRVEVLKDALYESRWGSRGFTVDQCDSRSDALLLVGADLAASGPADICRHNYVTLPVDKLTIWANAAVPRPCRYFAYWASPLPKDQFSLLTSTRFMNTSSRRISRRLCSPSAIAL